MTETRRVTADLMSIDPIVVRPDTTIEEAERLLQEFAISGLPVVDDAGRPIGVISQTDLLATVRPPVGVLIRAKPSGLRVGELMSTPAVTVPIMTPLVEAARQMLEAHVHRLVVIDDHGRAVGVLSATDFVTLYAEG